jgi:hypothetical protein
MCWQAIALKKSGAVRASGSSRTIIWEKRFVLVAEVLPWKDHHRAAR